MFDIIIPIIVTKLVIVEPRSAPMTLPVVSFQAIINDVVTIDAPRVSSITVSGFLRENAKNELNAAVSIIFDRIITLPQMVVEVLLGN